MARLATYLALLLLGLEVIFSIPSSDYGNDSGRNFVPRRIHRSFFKEDFEITLTPYCDDPSTHYAFQALVNDPYPKKLEDQSVVLRGYAYNRYCDPPFDGSKQAILPSFSDCRNYYEINHIGWLYIRNCPKNSIFDPVSTACILFNKIENLPESCRQECPPYSNDIPVRDLSDIPIRDLSDIPIRNLNDIPIRNLNDIPIRDNDIPIGDLNDIPIRDLNDIPIRDLNDIPIGDLNDIPIGDLNDIPIRDLNDIPIRDLSECDYSGPLSDDCSHPTIEESMEDEEKLSANDRSASYRYVYESSTEKMADDQPLEIHLAQGTVVVNEDGTVNPIEDQEQPELFSRLSRQMGNEDDYSSGEKYERSSSGRSLASEFLSKSKKFTIPVEVTRPDVVYDEVESSSYPYTAEEDDRDNYEDLQQTTTRRAINDRRRRSYF